MPSTSPSPRRVAVIMAGGGGTRLWPASWPSRPKQLIPGLPQPGATLLGATLQRLEGLVRREDVWVVTTAPQVEGIRLAAPDVPEHQILVEPIGRNTAPCVALAARHLEARTDDEDVTMIVLPADHHVRDVAGFRRHLEAACLHAERRDTVATLGIEPDRPETGYGYMERDPAALPPIEGDHGVAAHRALRFVEKPDEATARAYLEAGRYAWNAGIFCMPLRRCVADFGRCVPQTWAALAPVGQAVADGASSETLAEVVSRAYASIASEPIDVAVMEKLDDIVVVPASVGWTDLGSWASMTDLGAADASGNVVLGQPDVPVELIDTTDCLVWTEGARVGVVGLKGIAVVTAGDAVLVCPIDQAQQVRDIARAMASRGLTARLPKS